jgi:uncharacterized protein (TIRG00374 family)
MWAYLAAYEMPNDDPEALRERVRIDYPVQVDRAIGLGVPPTLRLQRLLRPPGEMRRVEKVLVWTHWVWFAVPHAATAYVLIRERERFGRAAATTYAVFDLGALVYHLLPTAPPWYAAERGRLGDARTPPVRRMMVEYGEQFWKHRWGPLYSVLGGNPLAAMPSLHFATSVNAAHLLAESGPLEGAVGWTYALTLGLALVYLGEHYAPLVPCRRSRRRPIPRPMAEDAVERAARAGLQEPSTAPLAASPGSHAGSGGHHDEEDMPRVTLTRRRVILFAVFVLASIAFLYFVLPQIGGVREAYERVSNGDRAWLAAALAFQIAAIVSYVLLFHGVQVPPGSPLTHRDSYLITMASLAATRLFAAGGAGGVALTAWALRRSGMERREVAERMIAFLVLLYGIYVLAMLVFGVGLRTGLLPGEAPFGLTVVPAIVSGIAIVLFGALALVPEDFEQRIERMASRRPRLARWLRRFALGPASMRGGIRFALRKAVHPDRAMLGAVTWWAFNIAILWASFHAFGEPPPTAVLVQAFFVGMLANLLPIPGGIGGVDGGMIGALAAFGVPAGTAVLAVLSYRLFAFWLPTVPGVIAYFQLRRRVQEWRHRLSPA